MTDPSGRLRVGVDVGGTFTKAVAIDIGTLALVATSIVPTTHSAAGGVAEGVVAAVADVASQVGADRIDLVTHSTTQAVNALLEGDVGVVGVIGMGRRPDLKKVAKLTQLRNVEVAAGKYLSVRQAFFDVTDGLPSAEIRAELADMRRAGMVAVAIAEAFSPDDSRNEHLVAALAREVGIPACASTELSGLYGLELRTVTAALNASILPIAVATADFVSEGVRSAGIHAAVMVMRSDGGATDLDGFREAPVRTLYSGPSASVSGALRYTGVTDAIVVEVGGTSTNIAAIRNGRPSLSYVRVASHATALRSVDVRVVGVAGGSMLRVRRGRVHGVGPRSAHIAGLRYACFAALSELDGAKAILASPIPGDTEDFVLVELPTGERLAITNTCAANALGVTRPGDYCSSEPQVAMRAFDLVSSLAKSDGPTVAQQMLTASGEAICELVLTVASTAKLSAPTLVGVGGGAGGLARHVAAMLGWPIALPEHAEVISSIGDALSLLRAERERTVESVDECTSEAMMREVEAEVLAAGASPASIEVRLEEVPERSIVRAIATGAVGLSSGALPGRTECTDADIRARHLDAASLESFGAYWIATNNETVTILDRYGDELQQISGRVAAKADLAETIADQTRYRGPVTLRPSVWIVDKWRLLELASFDVRKNPYGDRSDVVYIVGRTK